MTSKVDRLRAALAGEVADRPPIAIWRHFPVDDQSPDTLAEAVLAFQRDHDFDLIKVTPASSYCVRDWGVTDEWQGSTEGTRSYRVRRVRTPSDWRGLETLDARAGRLGEHLAALTSVVTGRADEVPVLATVFSPLAQAKNLAGEAVLAEHLRSSPQEILDGLEHITRTTVEFIAAARGTGIEGIFYAVQHAGEVYFDWPGYRRLALGFDRRIVEAADGLPLNMLHLHGEGVFFDLARSLPVAVVNWHDRETAPDLRQGRQAAGKAVCGGLSREKTLLLGNPQQVGAEARQALDLTDGGRGLILGTGCVAPIHTPRANLRAARMAFEPPGAGG